MRTQAHRPEDGRREWSVGAGGRARGTAHEAYQVQALLAFLLFALSGVVSAGAWVPIGPADGGAAQSFGAIATHPRMGGTALIVAGSVPGVDSSVTYYTSDHGGHWSANARLTGFGRPFLAGSPTIALLDQTTAILRSTDRGRSWAPIPMPPPPPGRTYRLWAVNPTNPAELVLAAGLVVARTDNGGASWSNLDVPKPIAFLAVDWSTRHLFAVFEGDATLAHRPLDASGAWVFTVQEAKLVATDRGIVLVEDSSGKTYRSVDGGSSFAQTALSLGPLGLCDIRFAPSPSTTAYGLDCLTGQVIRSLDDGSTWVLAGRLPPGLVGRSLSIDASISDRIYVATSRGFLVSRDGGLTYASLARRSGAPGAARRLLVDPHDGRRRWLADESPGSFRTLGLERWSYAPGAWAVIGSSRVRANTLFGFGVEGQGATASFGISVDGGASWTATIAASGADAHYGPMADGGATGPLFLSATAVGSGSTIVRALYKSGDDGASWSAVAAPPVGVIALAATRTGRSVLYAGGTAILPGAPQLFRSADSATSWEPVTTFPAFLGGALGNTITSFAIDPADPSRIYAGFRHPDHLLRSDDAGATWTRMTRGLGTGEVSSIVVDPSNPTTVYVSQIGSGVYRSVDRGANWVALDAGLADDVVRQLDLDPLIPGLLYASSGSGLFQADLRFAAPTGSRRAIEFHHGGSDHYFVTADADEIAALDDGVIDGWRRTGEGFRVAEALAPGTEPVCRFFGVGFGSLPTHFYTPYVFECNKIMNDPHWSYEKIAFGVALPDPVTRGCGPGMRPLARLWNDGRSGAPNHRYTTSRIVLNEMLDRGWIFEGVGSTRVFACVPQ